MNILWVSPFLPKSDAPHAGGRSIAQWIESTSERHRVTLLCRIEPAERVDAEAWRPRLGGLHLQEFTRPSAPWPRRASPPPTRAWAVRPTVCSLSVPSTSPRRLSRDWGGP